MSPARRPPVRPVLRAVLVAAAAALMFPAASAATTYTVTSTANSGAGTLAQAIDDANAHANSLNSGGVPDTIAFGLTGGAPYTIALTSELSHLTEAVVIDGTTQSEYLTQGSPVVTIDGSQLASAGATGLYSAIGGNTINGLAIGGFLGSGIKLEFGGGNQIASNYVGIDAGGAVLPNGIGVSSTDGNTIDSNTISGNTGKGIDIVGNSNFIHNNKIGIDPTLSFAIANGGAGISISASTLGSTVTGNTVAGNTGDGITVDGDANNISSNQIGGSSAVPNGGNGVTVLSGTGNRISSNLIDSNIGMGIDLGADGATPNDAGDGDTGPNGLQNFPVITNVDSNNESAHVDGTLDSPNPAGGYTIEVFSSPSCDASGSGEGATMIGSASTLNDGSFHLTLSPFSAGLQYITATATDAATGSTSEFSAATPFGNANILPTCSAPDLAAAIAADPSTVTGASFVTAPPFGTPNALTFTPLASFPTAGGDYAILTTGNATIAADANGSGSSGPSDGGSTVRGNSDMDVTILKVNVTAPVTANCLTIDFRFLSEEFPEFVGGSVNDAFIAELDTSDWSTSASSITAPHNFAFDPSGDVISVNSSGVTSMTAGAASGTTYDGATPRLHASTPVAGGSSHSLYLSIFDQGDQIYDSAVFVDNLVFTNVAASECVAGAVPDAPPSGGGGGGGGGSGGGGSSDSSTTTTTATTATTTAPSSSPTGSGGQQQPPTQQVPPPVGQESGNLLPESGTVLVKVPGSLRYVPVQTLTSIPVGSLIDARKGVVLLTVSDGLGHLFTGEFRGGLFRFSQHLARKGSKKLITDITLAGGKFAALCGTGKARAASWADTSRRRVVRYLNAKANGSFNVVGKHAAGLERGTEWKTIDTCDSTEVHVILGTVLVTDLVKHKTFVVKAPKTYIAHAQGNRRRR